MSKTLTLQERVDKLKAEAKQLKGELHLDLDNIRGPKHLNVLWYGGTIATLDYRGLMVTIEARGDVRVNGAVNGVEFECSDSWEDGALYQELALEYDIDDKKLARMAQNESGKNWIYYGNNNWFEWNIYAEGMFIDCFDLDNVVSDDLLEACNPKDIAEWIDLNWDWIQDQIKNN